MLALLVCTGEEGGGGRERERVCVLEWRKEDFGRES